MTRTMTGAGSPDPDPLADYVHAHAARALIGIDTVDRAVDDLTVDLVHDTRTSLRRLRGTVRSFPAAFEHLPEYGDHVALDADLQAVALAFGEVRDADVLAELLLPALDELPSADGARPSPVPPARALLTRELDVLRDAALAQLRSDSGGSAWGRTADLLRTWRTAPPSLPHLDPVAVLEGAEARVRRRLTSAADDPAQLHSARKAAKRWRYAAELLLPLGPIAAERLARAEPYQELLGRVQDVEIARTFLAALDPEPEAVPTLENLLAHLLEMQQKAITAVRALG
ncbi:CHAD domain-containing protein [Brachybacterium aquaticum]|uniref:CHAD domain-containing protein n=1 Tax=Brachybacterium aquaticum TaxID=1432564 RepID=A0A841A922_9MICO|nr:CHAD domain-containing protein [Brachybacterium aquaticum]MBB5831326.1 CHAD domain-containing protein [Brachybacterium aquaticum]